MITCRDVDALLAAYVDGETGSCDCDQVRAHVDACAVCRERVAAQRSAREVLHARRTGLRACAPAHLKARCASLAAQRPAAAEEKPERSAAWSPRPAAVTPRIPASFLRRWAPLSVAATLVFAVAAVFGLGLNDKVQALAFQTTIDHVACTRFNAGSGARDPLRAATEWREKAGWPITIPAAASSNLELRAVRRCGVIDGSLAHLMYSWMGEPLSVYVLPKRTVGHAEAFVHRFGHNAVMWSQNERTYIVVTRHPRDAALEKVVAYVRAGTF